MSHTFNKDALKDKVVKGRHDEVFEELLIDSLHEDLQNQVRLLETRHHTLERTNNQGTLPHDDYKIERARIDKSLFQLVDDIDKELAKDTSIVTEPEPVKPTSSGGIVMSSSSPPPNPSHIPTESSRSGTLNPVYMALAVFGALILGALLVLMGFYFWGKGNRIDNPNSNSDKVNPMYVEAGDSTDFEPIAHIKEGPKQVPSSASKNPSPEKTTSAGGAEIVAILEEKIEPPTAPKRVHERDTNVTETFPPSAPEMPARYKCQENCKRIRIEYNTKYEFVIYIKQDGQKKEVKKIKNKGSIEIEKGTHDIILKDTNRNEELWCSSCVITDSTTYIRFSHQYKNIEAK